jgi:predicted RNase H-like HicB family nuclease
MTETVRMRYHHEPEGWWADSPDVAGFTAVGADIAEVRTLVKEGIRFHLETDDVEIYEDVVDRSLPAVVEIHLDATALRVDSDATPSGYTMRSSARLLTLLRGSADTASTWIRSPA